MLPYANVTSSNERVISGFVREPDGRGTFGILFSCLAVLLLNTWTVLHLNIPPRTTPWRQYLHKVKWWAIAMICPDGLAVSACEQWRNARTSVKVLKKVYPWWTVTHGYYAEMGGFRIEPETGNKQEYAFRVKELIWLTEHKIVEIPEVRFEELHDKSNADWLVKGIAITQSTWFMLQLCARINQELPITTLELVTVAFISCTVLMYFFWWDKPMDIETSTSVHIPELTTAQLCLLAKNICLSHKGSEWYRPPPKEAHDHGWDWFWFERRMIIKRLEIISRGDSVPEELQRVV